MQIPTLVFFFFFFFFCIYCYFFLVVMQEHNEGFSGFALQAIDASFASSGTP